MRMRYALVAACLAFAAQVYAVDLQLVANLDGKNVVSATESTATGQGVAMLSDDGKLTLDVAFAGLAGEETRVELLMGKPSENGAMIESLNVGEGDARKTGMKLTLTPGQAQAMRDGNTYLMVRTLEYPAGEIRGQLIPQTPSLLGVPVVP